MGIDANIALSGKPTVQLMNPNEIMNMRRLAQQNQEYDRELSSKNTMRDILKRNVTTDASGRSSLNQQGVLSDAYNADPIQGMAYKKQFDTNNLEELKNQAEAKKSIVMSMNDETSYFQGRDKAIQLGLPGSEKLPKQYPGLEMIKNMQASTGSNSEQLQQQWKQKEFEQKEREITFNQAGKTEDRNFKQQELGIKRSETAMKVANGDRLPLDAKKTVEKLADKNANITSIRNEINAFLDGWEKETNPDQRLKAGEGLLKTLNSTQGSDAVGAEESKRLGSMLQFAMGNFTNGNPTQWGRDLDGFKTQVTATRDKLNGTWDANKKEIDSSMGRQAAPAPATVRMTDGKGGFFDIPQAQYGEAISSGLKKGG